MKPKPSLLILAALLTACNSTPATPTNVPSATPLPPTATATPIPPTATAKPSLTPSPTATERPTQTLTPTPADTDTPTPSATLPRPTAVPATAVPTATNTQARVDAPLFSRTEIVAWDSADFRKELGELSDNTQAFRTHLQLVLDGRKGSSCRLLNQYIEQLYINQRGYTGVPDIWYRTYYEYRIMVNDAFAGLAPIAANCPIMMGGEDAQFNAEDAAVSIPTLDHILARVPQIFNEVAGLP